MMEICINGRFQTGAAPALAITDKSYRYGDGLFETMKMQKGHLQRAQAHFDRLQRGIKLLGYDITSLPDPPAFTKLISELCRRNECLELGRVRLTVSAGNGGLLEDSQPNFSIECWPLTAAVETLNSTGLRLTICPGVRKSHDWLANLKSANFLPYAVAARYARQQQADDCIVLNTDDRIADTCIANIFMIRDGKIFTPPLTEAPVAGVTRQYLLGRLPVIETPLSLTDLQQAQEVFVTNAINGLRWVAEIDGQSYTHQQTTEIFRKHMQTITG